MRTLTLSLTLLAIASAIDCYAQNPESDSAIADSLNTAKPTDSISATSVQKSIEAMASFRFTPPPKYPVMTSLYGQFDSIRGNFLDTARTPFPSRGIFDDAAGSAMIAGWNSGAVSAYGSIRTMPGLAGIEQGGLQVVQRIGNVTIGAGAFVDKYAYFGGLKRNFGFQGTVHWRINDTFSIYGFGTYYDKRDMFISPAIAGYTGSHSYGAALRIDASEKWGMDIGAQRVYNVMSGRWETVPIARPFFKINGKEAIGIDVGGILHELLRSKIGGGHGNPTMGPPIPSGYPPVRPREDW